jgi:bla regulator protein BlaR1
MIVYIFKTVCCSALLMLFYFLLLEKEKMHRFNRWYLLCSIIFSFIIPLINITTTVTQNLLPVDQLINTPENNLQEAIAQQTVAATQFKSFLPILSWSIYSSISIFLLTRFLKNIFHIYHKIKNNKSVQYYTSRLVLTTDKIIPHSFLHYIFIDKDGFESSGIEKEILSHELTHVQQKHSLDILLVELLLVFCWFNPFLYLYRKAIQLNHEFLADEAVINIYKNTTAYQYLLLEKATQPGSVSFTSQFNYLITKKRLVMMTRTTSPKVALLKQFALLPLLSGMFLLFSSRSYTQSTGEKPTVVNKKIEYGTGASQELLNEYDATLKNMIAEKTTKNGQKIQVTDMGKGDIDRLGYIFGVMNKEQRDYRISTTHVNIVPLTAPAKKAPDATQLQNWKNAAKYGVWIDGKRIASNDLSKYAPSDFAFYWESKLAKNAVNYGKHYYQVNLYTASGYDNSYIKNSHKFMFWYLK